MSVSESQRRTVVFTLVPQRIIGAQEEEEEDASEEIVAELLAVAWEIAVLPSKGPLAHATEPNPTHTLDTRDMTNRNHLRFLF